MPSKSKSRRLRAGKPRRPAQLKGSSSSGLIATLDSPAGRQPTCFVFRSVVVGKSWDQFESISCPSSSPRPVSFLLRSCGSTTANISHEDHLNMGWNHAIRSPYISFSSDLHWAIYYQLKHEHINKSNPSSVRHLYALEVIAIDVQNVSVSDLRAQANARAAREMLGTFQVRVVRKLSLMDLIPAHLRALSSQWFSEMKRFGSISGTGAKYPFARWKAEMRRVCAREFDAIAQGVDTWKAQVFVAVHPKPSSSFVAAHAANSHSLFPITESTPLLASSRPPIGPLADLLPLHHSRPEPQVLTGHSSTWQTAGQTAGSKLWACLLCIWDGLRRW
ncbi:hypothetical protein BCR44DRAFT_42510 [Catenaria anguillulae PL171]|uniref:Uncharacterized protein n=1 Tax=Catenaria anguillulae PL171 TaxID=765915 RepID=A0A1Y2HVI5_9FUNG|nr:hypothetical protein BCR44DRAFT_42510 [Catenaria anguillulae PL171]